MLGAPRGKAARPSPSLALIAVLLGFAPPAFFDLLQMGRVASIGAPHERDRPRTARRNAGDAPRHAGGLSVTEAAPPCVGSVDLSARVALLYSSPRSVTMTGLNAACFGAGGIAVIVAICCVFGSASKGQPEMLSRRSLLGSLVKNLVPPV